MPNETSEASVNVATDPLTVAVEIVGTPVAAGQGEVETTVTFDGVGVGIAKIVEVEIGLLATIIDSGESTVPFVARTA